MRPSPEPFDEITAGLREMRAFAGEPSYAELARRVIEQRVARGVPVWEARVGRTTVYDAFRQGRRVIDPGLVGDLVRALGATAEHAEVWVERCEQARHLARTASVINGPAGRSTRARQQDRPGESATAPAADPRSQAAWPSPRARMLLLVGCVALNLVGREFVLRTQIPLYLDMVGTAIAAIAIGPWAGVLVGIVTSVAGAGIDGWISVPFVPVEIVGALLWGYGIRLWGCGRSISRFFLLNIVVAVGCTIVAVPIIVWLDHGITGDGADQMTRSMLLVWHSLLPAVASQNVVTSIADKLISGFTAVAVCDALSHGPTADRVRIGLGSEWRAYAARLAAVAGR